MKELQSYIIEKFKIKKGVQAKEYPPTEKEKANETALKIVSTYFGGYIPNTLEEEGFEFNTDEEKYKLIERMESYFVEETNFNCSESEASIIHIQLTEWVEKHNK